MVAKVNPVSDKMALRFFPSTPNSCWTRSSESRRNLNIVKKRLHNRQFHLKTMQKYELSSHRLENAVHTVDVLKNPERL